MRRILLLLLAVGVLTGCASIQEAQTTHPQTAEELSEVTTFRITNKTFDAVVIRDERGGRLQTIAQGETRCVRIPLSRSVGSLYVDPVGSGERVRGPSIGSARHYEWTIKSLRSDGLLSLTPTTMGC